MVTGSQSAAVTDPPPPAQRWKPSATFTTALICAVCLLEFFPALGGGYVWDDLVLIEKNAHLRGPGAGLRAITAPFWDSSAPHDADAPFYRPIVKLSQALLVGAGPLALHGLNLMLHLLATLLVARWVTLRLMGTGHSREAVAVAVLPAALLFALHTSRFESVGWVSGSADLFFGVFVLWAAVLFEQDTGRGWAVVPLALAALSKETALVVPALFVGDAVARGQVKARAWALVGAFGAVFVAIAARLAVHIPLPSPAPGAGIGERLWSAAATIAGYHQRTLSIVPTVLPFDVPSRGPGRFDAPPDLVAVGAVLAVGWLALLAAAVRWPRVRPWVADACWWLVPLLPVMNLVASPNKLMVADRYLYLPLAGVAALAARAIVSAREPRWSTGLAGATVAAALLCASQLGPALFAFESNQRFFAREVALHPRSPTAREYYAIALTGAGTTQQQVLEEALLTLPIEPAQRVRMTIQLAVMRSGTGLEPGQACQLLDFFRHLDDVPVPLVTPTAVLPNFSVEAAREVVPGIRQAAIGKALAALECGAPGAVEWALGERARLPGNTDITRLALRFLTRAGQWDRALAIASADLDPSQHGSLLSALTPAPFESERDRLLRISRVDALLGPPRAAIPLIEQALGVAWDPTLARALVPGLLAEGKVERAHALVEQLGDDELARAVALAQQDVERQATLAHPKESDW